MLWHLHNYAKWLNGKGNAWRFYHESEAVDNYERNWDFKGGLWKSTAKSDEGYWCSRKIIH